MEAEQRALVVRIARGWLRTPYRSGARVKGAGADCLTLLSEVYTEAGLIARPEIPYYPKDFMQHRGEERYLEGLLGYTREVGAPLPGDIALWRFGRCYSHGAIVVAWPSIIHAHVASGCVLEDAISAQWLSRAGKDARPVKFFSYWGA